MGKKKKNGHFCGKKRRKIKTVLGVIHHEVHFDGGGEG